MLNTAAWSRQYFRKAKGEDEPSEGTSPREREDNYISDLDESLELELSDSEDGDNAADGDDDIVRYNRATGATPPLGASYLEYRPAAYLPSQEKLSLAERYCNPIKQTAFRCCTQKRRASVKKFARRSCYYFCPIVLWLPKYSWKENFLTDFAAGIACACLIVPQALAYALLARVPPIVGLYTSWMPALIYPCLTTSKHVSIGPDALGSLLVGMTLGARPDEDPLVLAPLFALIIGITMIVMGILSFGFLDNVLSRPLLSGFVNAVACIILVEQLVNFFGIPPLIPHAGDSHVGTLEKVWHWLINLKETNFTTLGVGILSLMILIGFRLLKQYLPHIKFIKYIVETLIVVIFGIIASVTLNLDARKVSLLGHIDAGSIPLPEFPNLTIENISKYFGECMVIVIIGFVETIVAAKLFATKHNYRISPNRELVALGVSNVVGSFFHIYPTFGSLPRTAVADYMGCRSELYSFVLSCLVLIIILFLAQFFAYLPKVVMSSIIIIAAYSLLELHDIVFLWKVKAWKDLTLLIFTFVVTIIVGVDLGIFIGMGISLLLVVRHTSFPRVSLLAQDDHGKWVDATSPNTHALDGIIVVRIEEALYFANMEQIKDMFKRIEFYGRKDAHPADEGKKDDIPTGAIIIHAKNIQEIDASAMQIMVEMIHEYQKRNVFVCFVKLKQSLLKYFFRAGILNSLNGDRTFASMEDATKYVQIHVLKTLPNDIVPEDGTTTSTTATETITETTNTTTTTTTTTTQPVATQMDSTIINTPIVLQDESTEESSED